MVCLAVMAGAGYYVFNQAAAGGGYVTVPNIVGKRFDEASYLLAANGLGVGPQTAKASQDVAPYHVIAQTPEAGKVVRTGRRVYPTVSKGPDYQMTPDLMAKLVDMAMAAIEQNDLKIGSTARIPHPEPRETVIGQDPAPGREILAGAEVHLLVSSGSTPGNRYMPDLLGKTLPEVTKILAPLGVDGVALRVDRPDAPFDIVLDQRPQPGTLVGPGEKVVYEIRPSTQSTDLWRERQIEYTVPPGETNRAVRIEMRSKDGGRTVLFPRPQDYVDGRPPRVSRISVPLRMKEDPSIEATVEVYLDNRLVRTYFFQGDADPIVEDYTDSDAARVSPQPEGDGMDGAPEAGNRITVSPL